MVIGAHPFRLVCLALLLSIGALHAKDLAAYRIGDAAEENITTPVALDVMDAEATAARKAAEALKTPAIFRSYPGTTNATVTDFLAAFETNRVLFNRSLYKTFGETTSDDETIASPGFAKFVAAFNRKKIPFPVSTELAGVWARGDDGSEIQTRLLAALLKMTHRPIRPDELPPGFRLGETLRLVTVDGPRQNLTLAEAEQRGKLVTLTSVTTVSRLRDLFRRPFSEDEKLMARGVGKYLKTNCELDTNLTQQARDRDISQLVVVDHYDAGQVIVPRGEIINAKDLAMLAQLNEKLMPGRLAAQREQERTAAESAAAQKARDEKADLQSQALAARVHDEWLLAGFTGLFMATLAAAGMLVWHRRRKPSLLPVHIQASPLPAQALFQANLSPQIAQILKEAVVQGLAAQRIELLQAQQAAAAEISALVHRLDELKTPMQDRLRSYEERIRELEKDLAERNEENRELLRMKIEMTRRQLEAERARRVDFN